MVRSGRFLMFLVGSLVLAVRATAAGDDDVRLSGSAFTPGTTAQVTVTGRPGSRAALFLIPDRGAAPEKDVGARQIASVKLPEFGAWSFFLPVPPSTSLEGVEFSLVCLLTDPHARPLAVSNRLPVIVSAGPTLRTIVPEPDSQVVTDTIFEVTLHGSLDPGTVNARTVALYDLDATQMVRVNLALKMGKGRTLISIAPATRLAHGHAYLLTLDRSIANSEGKPMPGTLEAKYFTAPATFPRVLLGPEELVLMRERVRSYQNPWRSAYDNLKAEADQEALPGLPDPIRGPLDEAGFDDGYARWSKDMRYALYLGLVALVADDERCANKAKEYVLAWTGAFKPEPVGPWQNAIKYDLAGLLLVDACDLLAARGALNPLEWQSAQSFLLELAAAVRRYHESGNDARTEPAGCYVKSWDDALLAAIGQLLDSAPALDYARSARANPYSFDRQLERAIAPDGSLVDEYRGEEKEHYRVTYPLYHLQALGLISDIFLRRGEMLFGAKLLGAWEHYLPYVNGSLPCAWPDEETRLHYGVSKYVLPLAAYRSPAMHELVASYEPIWEPHLLRKAASLVGRIGPLIGTDRKPPPPPHDVRLQRSWSTGLLLSWDAAPVEDEGDLVLRYLVYRNGALAGTTTETVFVDRTLEPQTGYRYEVRAVDRAENQSAGVLRTYYTAPLP